MNVYMIKYIVKDHKDQYETFEQQVINQSTKTWKVIYPLVFSSSAAILKIYRHTTVRTRAEKSDF